ncbi:MAG: hypothetical protein FWD94_01225 [Treponema sp.]|nr:hypothetical protein [Treponema sp.]
MMLAIDDDAGILRIGSPPETLPGIVDRVRIDGSLLIDEVGIQGRSGKVKVVQGWNDAAVSVSLILLDDPGGGLTRWDALKRLAGAFRKVGGGGKPETYTLGHPMIAAWGTRKMLFKSLETAESRTGRKITATLEFVEYDSSAGVVQERQAAESGAMAAAPSPSPSPPISDGQRRGLGTLEARYG